MQSAGSDEDNDNDDDDGVDGDDGDNNDEERVEDEPANRTSESTEVLEGSTPGWPARVFQDISTHIFTAKIQNNNPGHRYQRHPRMHVAERLQEGC